jgi:hypothetical protein
MQFRADQYYNVGLERMEQARKLYHGGAAFALAMYSGGLAVECLLRAFPWTEDRSFEGRHDLSDLLKASRFLTIDEDYLRRRGASEQAIHESASKLKAAMNDVVALWHNNLRFASEASLKTILNRVGRLQGVKGDPLRNNARALLEAAQDVVDRGVTLWASGIKS